jgi:hypothetical protein
MPATIAYIMNGGPTLLPVAPPPPPTPPAPAPPATPPVSSAPPIDPGLLAAAGVTQAQYEAAEQAAAVAAASTAALMAGEGSAGMAAAAAAAGASQDVVDALAALGIPDLSQVIVTGYVPPDGSVEGTDDEDEAGAEANANRPDLSDLPEWELYDPYSLQLAAVTNPPLKGGGAITAIAQACSDYGVDAMAAIADALHEGANGGMGDGGHAYGPFQDHLTDFAGRPFYGKGVNNPVVNAWAWSDNGIRYAVRQMVNTTPSARGLRGHAAVYAIVYGYERPADKSGAYKTRAAEYDHLLSLGSGWPAYAAALFKGPTAGGAVDNAPVTSGSDAPYKPAGVTAQWRGLVDVFKTTVPQQHSKVDSISKSLVGVFK